MYIKYTLNIYYVLDTVWMKHQGYNSERKKVVAKDQRVG